MQNSLQGKKILVTGGSRGIGASIVKILAQKGAQVAFTYSSREEQAQEVLKSLPGSGHLCLKMDVSSEDSVQSAVDNILKSFESLDGLVNNAGITKDQLMLRMKTEDFDTVVQTNLRGTFLVTKACLKPMLKARNGSVVSITSVVGQTGNQGQANYSASKAGIEAFSKSLALEVSSRNIRLNCVAPGYIATDMTDSLSEQVKQEMINNIPLGTIGHAEDVGYAVSFLLSDEAKYITGHTLNVNGGLYMG